MGYGPLGRISHPPDSFLLAVATFRSSVHFKATPQGQAFRKLVAMRRPFFENSRSGDLLTRFTTDVDGMADGWITG